FATAVTRYREIKSSGDSVKAAKTAPKTPLDDMLALLRLDPKFIRLSDAVTGMHELSTSAPAVERQWQSLARSVTEKRVGAVSADKTAAEEQLGDASAVAEDLRRLVDQIRDQKAELAAAIREGRIEEAAG